ncbi:MAG TPA: hemerythrin domain-containing protein [Rhodocyclaceae bacterium]|nr:hemerythrin domain-containing protein [Rhodocyclaceae bacterium]
MPNRSTSRAQSKSTRKTATRRTATENNVIALLKADHKKVKKMFKEFEKYAQQGDEAAKVEIAMQICMELKVHTQVEEEILYPALYEALDEHDLVDEAIVEHATAKELIAQIESMVGSDDLYDAKVMVLSEYIDHHVEEEEKEIFPKARKARMDLEGLGESVAFRKEELMAPMATH